MNTVLWIAQIILAATFLVAGAGKLIGYNLPLGAWLKHLKSPPHGVSRGFASVIGLAEIVGALGVVAPAALTPEGLASDFLLVRLAAAGLALIMALAAIHHMRRKEDASLPATLFLLALFVIVGRWPR